jgi:cobalt/nickel transport system ATP-binding protein
MSHHRLDVTGLIFAYQPGQKVIENLNFSILHGESVGIIGANGAGKSTLLLLLLGVLWPQSGQVTVGNLLMTKKTLPLIRQRLGLVFQDPDDQLFMPTLYDDVAFGPRNAGLEEPQVRILVEKALDQVGILHLQNRPPYRLSGGEKKVAAIATVLAMEPDVLILDEPTASLDPRARRRIMAQLAAFDHTKIVTSHDLDMILETCSRTIVLRHGQVVADGPSRQILADRTLLESAGLELPLALQNCPICQGEKSRKPSS